MRKFIEDLFAIAMLIGTEAWFLKGYYAGQSDFEPALAFVASLGVLLAKDPIRAHFKPADGNTNHDQQLFQSFLNVLPPNQTTRFFKEHDFGDSFLKSDVAPLYAFVETWDSVEKEFLDKELESKRNSLYALASELASEIAGRTVPLRGGDFVSVFSDQQRASGQPRPDSVINDAKVINGKASQFVPKYEEFVRICRSKLAK